MSITAVAIHKLEIPAEGNLPEEFGFRIGERGTMASRTIMLDELATLLEAKPAATTKADCWAEIIGNNLLGKRTVSTRRITAQKLSELYALDSSVLLFRLLQFFWQLDPAGRPLLALLCACARDPLLRLTAAPVLQTRSGEMVATEQLEAAVARETEGRFNPRTLSKIGRNAASSWAQSGHLSGRSHKRRSQPQVTVGNTTYALLLGYLTGARGVLLLSTFWSHLLDAPEYLLHEFAREAAARGWLSYRRIDNFVELDFSALLTGKEKESLA
jgi:hypothetical protein